jgi:hypothetical protein
LRGGGLSYVRVRACVCPWCCVFPGRRWSVRSRCAGIQTRTPSIANLGAHGGGFFVSLLARAPEYGGGCDAAGPWYVPRHSRHGYVGNVQISWFIHVVHTACTHVRKQGICTMVCVLQVLQLVAKVQSISCVVQVILIMLYTITNIIGDLWLLL